MKSLTKNEKSFIKVERISVKGNEVCYEFSTSSDLDHLFNYKHMTIEFMNGDFELVQCPEGILVIPIVSNLLPISWVFNSTLIIDELDKTFYDSINKFKSGYVVMYPELDFKGDIEVKEIINYEYEDNGTVLSFFSLGVDSLNTVIKHVDENMKIITLYGSDVPLKEKGGWEVLSSDIDDFADILGIENFFLKSDFRMFLNYNPLNEFVEPIISEQWWFGLQHGIGILSHGVIIAYLLKAKTLYIASSFTYSENEYLNKLILPCASSPVIDNFFKFADCSSVHDGYEFSRASKVQNIVDFSNETSKNIKMHVCWATKSGRNCNVCEKCARTFLALLSNKANPNDYGFLVNEETLSKVKENFYDSVYNKKRVKGWAMHEGTLIRWKVAQKALLNDPEFLQDLHLYDSLKWFLELDFDEIV